MKYLQVFSILVFLCAAPLFGDIADTILSNSTSKTLKYGWKEINEKWEIPNSEYSGTKTIIQNPKGEPIKELYFNDFSESIIDFVIFKERVFISIYEVSPGSNNRSWTFEIINSKKEQILYTQYSYQSPYDSFPEHIPIKTKIISSYPYFIAVDDIYIYYLNKNLTEIEKYDIEFDSFSKNSNGMPTPNRILYDTKRIEILYSFPNPYGIEKYEQVSYSFNIQ